ncbi:MAG: GIY-YIG nuclease family protein [Rhizomicrobium sp.]
MREHSYWVYLLASAPYGTLYTGVANNLIRRVWEHKEGVVAGFTRRYDVKTLVWHEWHENVEAAIAREKSLKRWRRDWKIALIEADNPLWIDLYPGLLDHGSRIGPAARPG